MDSTLIDKLRNAGNESSNAFINMYAQNEDIIVQQVSSFLGIKSELYCQDLYNDIDIIKFLSLYSDFTSLFMLPGKTENHLLHFWEPGDQMWKDRQITFPVEVLDGKVPEAYQLLPGYTTHPDNGIKEIVKRLSPLFDRGSFMLRPLRTVMFKKDPKIGPGRTNGIIYYANSDTPNDHWYIKSNQEKNSYVIDNGLNQYQATILCELTLPYLNNVGITDFVKIITDESDSLSIFRSTLKELMEDSLLTDKKSVNEIRNDKLRPQIEAINRKFTTILNMHRLSVGATVGAFTISLLGVTVTNMTNFQTLFNSLISGGTVGLLAIEGKYQYKMDKLKDNPFFLLWKISRAKSKQIINKF